MLDPATLFRRRFTWLLLAAAVPMLLFMVVLGQREMEAARAGILREFSDAGDIRRTRLEQLAAEVDTHIAVMRAFAEQRLEGEAALPDYAGGVDWPPQEADPGPERGMVMANPASLTGAVSREMAAISPVFALARAAHVGRPWLRWSYFFSDSRKFVAIYPWAPVLQMLGPDSPDAALASYFTYDLYTLGMPDKNADHSAYWSPVYMDAGGAGLMVTRAAPVWVAGRFRGIVGTDVLLSFLSSTLADFPAVSAQVAVIDQQGNLVATADGAATAGDGPVKLQGALATADLAVTAGKFVPQGGQYIAAAAIHGTPWRLVMAVPEAEVRAAVRDRLAPFGLLVAGVIVALAVVVALLDRHLVVPAVALAEFGAQPSADIVREGVPRVPVAFQPLTARIMAAARADAAQAAQLRAMVDGVPLRVVYLDAGLIYRDVNREFLAFLDLRADQVIGHHVRDVLGPAVEAQYLQITPALRRGETSWFDGWIEYKSVGRRYLQVSILPFVQAGETVPGYLTFTRDLTDLKQAEQQAAAQNAALAEREELYRSVVVSALDAIIVMDDQGVTREFNPAAEAVFGYAAADAVGRPVADLIVPQAARKAHTHGMDRYLASGEPHVIGKRIEVEAMRADGSLLPVELTVTEMHKGGDRLFVSHLRDLTEAKQLAAEMQAGRDRLQQAEKLSAMGSLLAGVAHELNNPLAIAVAQSTLLVERAPDEMTRGRAERIRAAAERCGRIVKSFLAMARQKPPQRAPVDMAEAVRTALEVVGYGLRSAGVQVDVALPAVLPMVDGDRDLLGQVCSNIFINAQQALITRPLPRQIKVTSDSADGFLTLRFQDNGPGVPEAVRDRIFDPYFTTKAVDVGTGIGLSISRNVIEAHGGVISLGETDMGGACFVIRLPLAAPGAGAEALDVASATGVSRHFLIVDDEQDVALVLAEVLDLSGHTATVVGSAAEGLVRLGQGSFDGVFTDLRMPGMDGADLALAVAERFPALAGKVVLMTGDTVSGPAHAASRGLTDPVVLEKPFTLDEVAAVLRRIA